MPVPDLVTAELTLTGRITPASNATFLGCIGDAAVVYKPIGGEKPLWDFPTGSCNTRGGSLRRVETAPGWGGGRVC